LSNSNNKALNRKKSVLERLIKNPTKSDRKIASDLKSYRQKIWRERKRFERENIIWGYTAIVDESKYNYVIYLVLLKLKPMSKELADLMTRRKGKHQPEKQNIRLINVLFVNGEYDWLIMFSAPNHAVARRYYDSLRIAYGEFLLEKPTIIDVNFALVREGKVNPELMKLYEFVPKL
jgi:DNA-binding Lrp family transcriptional regulator